MSTIEKRQDLLPKKLCHKKEHLMEVDDWVAYFSDNKNNGFRYSKMDWMISNFSCGDFGEIFKGHNDLGYQTYAHHHAVDLYGRWVDALIKNWNEIRSLGLKKSKPSGYTRENPAVIVASGVNVSSWELGSGYQLSLIHI